MEYDSSLKNIVPCFFLSVYLRRDTTHATSVAQLRADVYPGPQSQSFVCGRYGVCFRRCAPLGARSAAAALARRVRAWLCDESNRLDSVGGARISFRARASLYHQ